MRNRIKQSVSIEDVIAQIECEVRSYSRAVKAIMEIKEVTYKDAKQILNNRLTDRLAFKQ